MAQSTTFLKASDVVIKLDNAAGSIQDISGSTNRVSVTVSEDIEVLYKWGTQYPSRFSMGKDVVITVNVIYTTTANEGSDILKNWSFASSFAARTCEIYIPTTAVGSSKISGEFVLEECEFSGYADSGDPMIVQAVLGAQGEITLATVT